MKTKLFTLTMLVALCFYLPTDAKASGTCSELLSKFNRGCTLAPLTLSKGTFKETYNCPCATGAYCATTGFCKTNSAYTIKIIDPQSADILDGTVIFNLTAGANIKAPKIVKLSATGGQTPMTFSCVKTVALAPGANSENTWQCKVMTNCFDVDVKGATRVKNINNDCLANGDYWLTACEGGYCAKAVFVSVDNDVNGSITNYCATKGYQCGQFSAVFGKISCGTCSGDNYCSNGYKCLANVGSCANKDCGWDGKAKNPAPCGGTGAIGDHGNGKGGCQSGFVCDINSGHCNSVACRKNADCQALPSECLNPTTLWTDTPYCSSGTCGHSLKPSTQNTQAITQSCLPGSCAVVNGVAKCVGNATATCSCNDVAKPCCNTCKAGPTTKCGGGIMATSQFIIPLPPTCVATKSCQLSDFPRFVYLTGSSIINDTGKNDASSGVANVKTVLTVDPTLNYHPAMKFCDQLVTGGQSDWTLPSKDELMAILTNYFAPLKSGDSLVVINDGSGKANYGYYAKSGMQYGAHASSRSYYGDQSYVWDVDFIQGGGGAGYGPKAALVGSQPIPMAVLCVRPNN